MAYTTINKSTDYFRTKLYTGDETARSITFDESANMQPDLMWVKSRGHTASWLCNDAVRGATKRLKLDQTSTESTQTAMISAFNTNGFSLGTSTTANQNSTNFIAYNWKAGGGQGSSNTAGSINTTYTSVNTTSGFSISQYTGTGSAGATVGHGLGVAPKMIIVKGLTYADVWIVGGDNLGGWNKEMYLNSTGAVATNNNAFNGVAPTSSVFTLGSGNGTNKSGDDYIAYCFAEKTGYSKFGKYSAVGNVDGNFIYLGFKPSFFLAKRITDGTEPWIMFDNKRNPFNGVDKNLKPSLSEAEATQNPPSMDFLSNGIKFRNLDGTFSNAAGKEFIYMAFAEAPLVGTNNVPCTAR